MDLNLIKCEDQTMGLSTENISNLTTIVPNSYVLPGENVEMQNKFAAFQESETFQLTMDADDILRNGILVETNKGVVCMTLKDVLSSNLNLSVEDFKNVAAHLLSQEDMPLACNENFQNENEIRMKSEISDAKNDNSAVYLQVSETKPILSDVEMQLLTPEPVPKNIDVTNETYILPNLPPIQYSENIFNNKSIEINIQAQSNSVLTSETADTSENEKDKTAPPTATVKRRGGWPKGRKRKPELLDLPPKAPKTSYNIFLNERRKLYKGKLAFHEITRVVGNQWSNLSSDEKRPYIEKADEDKKRYREELRVYRQSDAYKLYLARKRKKRALDNLMSESDMDGTDDIDDEDNDMLYCDTCDQWFYNLHNKREHLLSRQHKMTVADDMNRNLASSDSENKGPISSISFSTSLDESSMDGTPIETDCSVYSKHSTTSCSTVSDSVHDNMIQVIESVTKREKEIKMLNARLHESIANQNNYLVELNALEERSNALKSDLLELREEESILEQNLFHLWNVPSLFVMNMNTVEYCVGENVAVDNFTK